MSQTVTDDKPPDDASNAEAPTPATGRTGLWSHWHLGALLAHLGLSIFFTWPLLLNFFPGNSALVPGELLVDRNQNLWNLWWVRQALFESRNPFVTDMIWYPTGVSLYYHTLNGFNGLLAVPLLSLFSLTTTYNIVVLFSFVTAGYGSFLLVHFVCGNRWAALAGSAVFAYSAYHIATMRGLLQLISLEWVPFFVLFLLLAVHDPPWRAPADAGNWLLKRGLPAGFFLLLVSLVDWYYTMYALMLAVLLALYYLGQGLLKRKTKHRSPLWNVAGQPVLRTGAVVAVFAVLVSPILIPTLRELRSTNYMVPAADAAISFSADLMVFLQPPRDNRLWGHLFTNRLEWPYGDNRYEVYLTYTALFLTGIALFASRSARPVLKVEGNGPTSEERSPAVPLPSKWFWAGCAVLFFLLALGPILQVNGNQVRGLPMPYLLVERVPVLNISRSPDRFDMPLTLCLAVLAGYGLNVLLQSWLKALSLTRRGLTLSLGAISLMALELAPVPYPQRPAAVASWYHELGKEPGRFSILQLPPQDDYWHGAFRMYDQTAHAKAIFGGYISREYPHPFLTSTPGFQELTYVDGGGDMFAAGPPQWFTAFARYQMRYVILEKDRAPVTSSPRPESELRTSREAIERVLGPSALPVHDDKDLEVYLVPDATTPVPFLTVGDGWEPRERREDGQTYRWMGEEATLGIETPVRQDAYLVFKAGTVGEAIPLVIYHGDYKVFEGVIEPGVRQYATAGPLGLPQGASVLRLVSPEGTTSPLELGRGDDPRQLSFVLFDVHLESVR